MRRTIAGTTRAARTMPPRSYVRPRSASGPPSATITRCRILSHSALYGLFVVFLKLLEHPLDQLIQLLVAAGLFAQLVELLAEQISWLSIATASAAAAKTAAIEAATAKAAASP